MRERLIKLAHDYFDSVPWYADIADLNPEELIDHLIANGVTIPVLCKECKHWADGVSGCTDHVKCCKIGYYMVGENGYCVYGGRKTDER